MRLISFTSLVHRSRTNIAATLLLALILLTAAQPTFAQSQGVTLDDILDRTTVERVMASPDGMLIAVTMQRPARPGEVYGRTSYEIDPSRNDVWILDVTAGTTNNITSGEGLAAGFWCTSWSPDGQHLAMLSTRPEGFEPRGGDNVRLYIWNKSSGTLSRLSDTPVVTQTRYGSPLDSLDFRGGMGSGTASHRCLPSDENAPFLWLDNHRLLAAMLPIGTTSGLISQYSMPLRHASNTLVTLHDGREPTVTITNSGETQPEEVGGTEARVANIQILPIDGDPIKNVTTVPLYPFRGELSVSVSPDLSTLAIMATATAIAPAEGISPPFQDDSWTVERQLGFASIASGTAVEWVAMPSGARYPLELLSWSPDSKSVTFRARSRSDSTIAQPFIAFHENHMIAAATNNGQTVGTGVARSIFQHALVAFGLGQRRWLLRINAEAHGANGDNRRQFDWWIVGPRDNAHNVTRDLTSPPEELQRGPGGNFYAVADGQLMVLNTDRRTMTPITNIGLPHGSFEIRQAESPNSENALELSGRDDQGQQWVGIVTFNHTNPNFRYTALPSRATVHEVNTIGIPYVIWAEDTPEGLFLRMRGFDDIPPRDLLSRNEYLANRTWGSTRVISYEASNHRRLNAAVILPPNYREGQRYPVITWVYGGYIVYGPNDFFLNRSLPGLYNLYTYASHGYVVLVPSMPLGSGENSDQLHLTMTDGVLPAIDRLIELGIADPGRIGVLGQSFGGYSVLSLVAQTERFKAAVSIAGVSDIASLYLQFDPIADSYGQIAHEASENWLIAERGQWQMGSPPFTDHDRYWRNSPLAYVDHIHTPLLLIHGDLDRRGQIAQSEMMFYALYRQGRNARLMRYWGESHSIAQSPANIRHAHASILEWFDTYLRPNAIGNANSAE